MTKTLYNPYEVLGVSREASGDDIRAAYRRLALKYHPDRNPDDPEAEERFKAISEAYATLRDPEARARFDRYGSTRPSAARPDMSTVDWQTIFREADINIDWDARGGAPKTGNAVFDVLFGAVTGMMRQSGLLPGENREVDLEISLYEARNGTQRRVRIPGPSVCAQCRGRGVSADGSVCPVCQGQRVVRSGAYVDVTVPPQVREGVRLRLRGLGGPGQPPGDAFVTVRIDLPSNVEQHGNDLYTDVAITPVEAERGTRLSVLGIDFMAMPGTEDSSQLRIPGGGLAGGDLWVTFRVGVWRGVWRQLRNALSGSNVPARKEERDE